MFLDEFYSEKDGTIQVSAEQASHFAKDLAGDFNPLHDPDAKRFCVPGDLLFSLVLAKYGLSQKMSFSFSGMVGHNISLQFLDSDAKNIDIGDANGKNYLHVERNGPAISDKTAIATFIKSYVAFSGHNFPDVLVPMMAEQNVMINPDRPLVIYESMAFDLEHTNFKDPRLELSGTSLDVTGKRGDARLHFVIKCGDGTVGTGFKKLALSGLREYDGDAIEKLCSNYLARKTTYDHSL